MNAKTPFVKCAGCGMTLQSRLFPLVNSADPYDERRSGSCYGCHEAARVNRPVQKPKRIFYYTEDGHEHKRAVRRALGAKRRAQQLLATPAWADHVEIKRVYVTCLLVSRKTKVPHHVDHIVPLAHPRVCGLHVHWNLQVIPAETNLRKGNKLVTKKSLDGLAVKKP